MAKSKKPKKSTAKKVVKKPAAKKTGAKKPAKKTAAKKPAAKSSAAKKPAKKPVVKKTAAKKPVKAKTAAPSMLFANTANPKITSPTNGSQVPANTNLTVTVTTDNTLVDYQFTLTDNSTQPPTVTQWTVTPTGSPFNTQIAANLLPANHSFSLKVEVAPGQGTGSNTINFTTGP